MTKLEPKYELIFNLLGIVMLIRKIHVILLTISVFTILNAFAVYASNAAEDKELEMTEAIIKMYDAGIFDSDPQAKDDTRKVKESYEEMQAIKARQDKHIYEAAVYKEAIRITNSTSKKDRYSEVEKAVMKKYGVSQFEAHSMIEKKDPRVQIVVDNIIKLENEKVMEQARKNVNSTGKYAK